MATGERNIFSTLLSNLPDTPLKPRNEQKTNGPPGGTILGDSKSTQCSNDGVIKTSCSSLNKVTAGTNTFLQSISRLQERKAFKLNYGIGKAAKSTPMTDVTLGQNGSRKTLLPTPPTSPNVDACLNNFSSNGIAVLPSTNSMEDIPPLIKSTPLVDITLPPPPPPPPCRIPSLLELETRNPNDHPSGCRTSFVNIDSQHKSPIVSERSHNIAQISPEPLFQHNSLRTYIKEDNSSAAFSFKDYFTNPSNKESVTEAAENLQASPNINPNPRAFGRRASFKQFHNSARRFQNRKRCGRMVAFGHRYSHSLDEINKEPKLFDNSIYESYVLATSQIKSHEMVEFDSPAIGTTRRRSETDSEILNDKCEPQDVSPPKRRRKASRFEPEHQMPIAPQSTNNEAATEKTNGCISNTHSDPSSAGPKVPVIERADPGEIVTTHKVIETDKLNDSKEKTTPSYTPKYENEIHKNNASTQKSKTKTGDKVQPCKRDEKQFANQSEIADTACIEAESDLLGMPTLEACRNSPLCSEMIFSTPPVLETSVPLKSSRPKTQSPLGALSSTLESLEKTNSYPKHGEKSTVAIVKPKPSVPASDKIYNEFHTKLLSSMSSKSKPSDGDNVTGKMNTQRKLFVIPKKKTHCGIGEIDNVSTAQLANETYPFTIPLQCNFQNVNEKSKRLKKKKKVKPKRNIRAKKNVLTDSDLEDSIVVSDDESNTLRSHVPDAQQQYVIAPGSIHKEGGDNKETSSIKRVTLSEPDPLKMIEIAPWAKSIIDYDIQSKSDNKSDESLIRHTEMKRDTNIENNATGNHAVIQDNPQIQTTFHSLDSCDDANSSADEIQLLSEDTHERINLSSSFASNSFRSHEVTIQECNMNSPSVDKPCDRPKAFENELSSPDLHEAPNHLPNDSGCASNLFNRRVGGKNNDAHKNMRIVCSIPLETLHYSIPGIDHINNNIGEIPAAARETTSESFELPTVGESDHELSSEESDLSRPQSTSDEILSNVVQNENSKDPMVQAKHAPEDLDDNILPPQLHKDQNSDHDHEVKVYSKEDCTSNQNGLLDDCENKSYIEPNNQSKVSLSAGHNIDDKTQQITFPGRIRVEFDDHETALETEERESLNSERVSSPYEFREKNTQFENTAGTNAPAEKEELQINNENNLGSNAEIIVLANENISSDNACNTNVHMHDDWHNVQCNGAGEKLTVAEKKITYNGRQICDNVSNDMIRSPEQSATVDLHKGVLENTPIIDKSSSGNEFEELVDSTNLSEKTAPYFNGSISKQNEDPDSSGKKPTISYRNGGHAKVETIVDGEETWEVFVNDEGEDSSIIQSTEKETLCNGELCNALNISGDIIKVAAAREHPEDNAEETKEGDNVNVNNETHGLERQIDSNTVCEQRDRENICSTNEGTIRNNYINISKVDIPSADEKNDIRCNNSLNKMHGNELSHHELISTNSDKNNDTISRKDFKEVEEGKTICTFDNEPQPQEEYQSAVSSRNDVEISNLKNPQVSIPTEDHNLPHLVHDNHTEILIEQHKTDSRFSHSSQNVQLERSHRKVDAIDLQLKCKDCRNETSGTANKSNTLCSNGNISPATAERQIPEYLRILTSGNVSQILADAVYNKKQRPEFENDTKELKPHPLLNGHANVEIIAMPFQCSFENPIKTNRNPKERKKRGKKKKDRNGDHKKIFNIMKRRKLTPRDVKYMPTCRVIVRDLFKSDTDNEAGKLKSVENINHSLDAEQIVYSQVEESVPPACYEVGTNETYGTYEVEVETETVVEEYAEIVEEVDESCPFNISEETIELEGVNQEYYVANADDGEQAIQNDPRIQNEAFKRQESLVTHVKTTPEDIIVQDDTVIHEDTLLPEGDAVQEKCSLQSNTPVTSYVQELADVVVEEPSLKRHTDQQEDAFLKEYVAEPEDSELKINTTIQDNTLEQDVTITKENIVPQEGHALQDPEYESILENKDSQAPVLTQHETAISESALEVKITCNDDANEDIIVHTPTMGNDDLDYEADDSVQDFTPQEENLKEQDLEAVTSPAMDPEIPSHFYDYSDIPQTPGYDEPASPSVAGGPVVTEEAQNDIMNEDITPKHILTNGTEDRSKNDDQAKKGEPHMAFGTKDNHLSSENNGFSSTKKEKCKPVACNYENELNYSNDEKDKESVIDIKQQMAINSLPTAYPSSFYNTDTPASPTNSEQDAESISSQDCASVPDNTTKERLTYDSKESPDNQGIENNENLLEKTSVVSNHHEGIIGHNELYPNDGEKSNRDSPDCHFQTPKIPHETDSQEYNVRSPSVHDQDSNETSCEGPDIGNRATLCSTPNTDTHYEESERDKEFDDASADSGANVFLCDANVQPHAEEDDQCSSPTSDSSPLRDTYDDENDNYDDVPEVGETSLPFDETDVQDDGRCSPPSSPNTELQQDLSSEHSTVVDTDSKSDTVIQDPLEQGEGDTKNINHDRNEKIQVETMSGVDGPILHLNASHTKDAELLLDNEEFRTIMDETELQLPSKVVSSRDANMSEVREQQKPDSKKTCQSATSDGQLFKDTAADHNSPNVSQKSCSETNSSSMNPGESKMRIDAAENDNNASHWKKGFDATMHAQILPDNSRTQSSIPPKTANPNDPHMTPQSMAMHPSHPTDLSRTQSMPAPSETESQNSACKRQMSEDIIMMSAINAGIFEDSDYSTVGSNFDENESGYLTEGRVSNDNAKDAKTGNVNNYFRAESESKRKDYQLMKGLYQDILAKELLNTLMIKRIRQNKARTEKILRVMRRHLYPAETKNKVSTEEVDYQIRTELAQTSSQFEANFLRMVHDSMIPVKQQSLELQRITHSLTGPNFEQDSNKSLVANPNSLDFPNIVSTEHVISSSPHIAGLFHADFMGAPNVQVQNQRHLNQVRPDMNTISVESKNPGFMQTQLAKNTTQDTLTGRGPLLNVVPDSVPFESISAQMAMGHELRVSKLPNQAVQNRSMQMDMNPRPPNDFGQSPRSATSQNNSPHYQTENSNIPYSNQSPGQRTIHSNGTQSQRPQMNNHDDKSIALGNPFADDALPPNKANPRGNLSAQKSLNPPTTIPGLGSMATETPCPFRSTSNGSIERTTVAQVRPQATNDKTYAAHIKPFDANVRLDYPNVTPSTNSNNTARMHYPPHSSQSTQQRSVTQTREDSKSQQKNASPVVPSHHQGNMPFNPHIPQSCLPPHVAQMHRFQAPSHTMDMRHPHPLGPPFGPPIGMQPASQSMANPSNLQQLPNNSNISFPRPQYPPQAGPFPMFPFELNNPANPGFLEQLQGKKFADSSKDNPLLSRQATDASLPRPSGDPFVRPPMGQPRFPIDVQRMSDMSQPRHMFPGMLHEPSRFFMPPDLHCPKVQVPMSSPSSSNTRKAGPNSTASPRNDLHLQTPQHIIPQAMNPMFMEQNRFMLPPFNTQGPTDFPNRFHVPHLSRPNEPKVSQNIDMTKSIHSSSETPTKVTDYPTTISSHQLFASKSSAEAKYVEKQMSEMRKQELSGPLNSTHGLHADARFNQRNSMLPNSRIPTSHEESKSSHRLGKSEISTNLQRMNEMSMNLREFSSQTMAKSSLDATGHNQFMDAMGNGILREFGKEKTHQMSLPSSLQPQCTSLQSMADRRNNKSSTIQSPRNVPNPFSAASQPQMIGSPLITELNNPSQNTRPPYNIENPIFSQTNRDIVRFIEGLPRDPMNEVALQDTVPNACACCGKEAMFLCSGCKSVSYCTVDCQSKQWKDHKPNCLKERQSNQRKLPTNLLERL